MWLPLAIWKHICSIRSGHINALQFFAWNNEIKLLSKEFTFDWRKCSPRQLKISAYIYYWFNNVGFETEIESQFQNKKVFQLKRLDLPSPWFSILIRFLIQNPPRSSTRVCISIIESRSAQGLSLRCSSRAQGHRGARCYCSIIRSPTGRHE